MKTIEELLDILPKKIFVGKQIVYGEYSHLFMWCTDIDWIDESFSKKTWRHISYPLKHSLNSESLVDWLERMISRCEENNYLSPNKTK